MQTDIAIVGAGLAGLTLALRLEQAGLDYQLFEAKGRVGGRVLTELSNGVPLDLGPSWFWPGQPRMDALLKELGLIRFDQVSNGSSVFEDERGRVQQGLGFASMQNSWRIIGGTAMLPEALAARLATERVRKDAELSSIQRDGSLKFADDRNVQAKKIVLTMPPRVIAGLNFAPALDDQILHALRGIPTWMAGHAKFFATYDRAFWRDSGLSGDAFSRRGPLAEIHDASPADDSKPAALFGFVGVGAAQRSGQDETIKQAATAQLVRLFGADAAKPLSVHYKDWAQDQFTATREDMTPLGHHPAYGMPHALRHLWDGKLILCGTETAPDTGGFMEGALAAAEATATKLIGD